MLLSFPDLVVLFLKFNALFSLILLQLDPHCSYKASIAVSVTTAASRFLLLYCSQVIQSNLHAYYYLSWFTLLVKLNVLKQIDGNTPILCILCENNVYYGYILGL